MGQEAAIQAILENQNRMFKEQENTRASIDTLSEFTTQTRVDIASLKTTVKVNSTTSARAITKLEALAEDVSKLHTEQATFKAKVAGIVVGASVVLNGLWMGVKEMMGGEG